MRISNSEVTQYVELLGSQGFMRVNHSTSYCSGSSKSLVIKRTDDGIIHVNCFRCGGWGTHNGSVRKVLRTTESIKHSHRHLSIPSDTAFSFAEWSPKAHAWISRYGITEAETKEHKIGYSDSLRRIVFPVFDSEGLAMMQTRRIYDDDPKPKYVTYKNRECIKIVPSPCSNVLCLTEDYLSAIKCGRFVDSMPVFSTKLTTFQLSKIVQMYHKFIIFFDDDNHIVKKNQIQLLYKLQQFGECRLITGEKQPKELSDSELNVILC